MSLRTDVKAIRDKIKNISYKFLREKERTLVEVGCILQDIEILLTTALNADIKDTE